MQKTVYKVQQFNDDFGAMETLFTHLWILNSTRNLWGEWTLKDFTGAVYYVDVKENGRHNLGMNSLQQPIHNEEESKMTAIVNKMNVTSKELAESLKYTC
uniref:MHC_I-like_Ag-recog domain-containing protein n=1 Tax=Rhabditophanes sp. KR3021 TaxID=114890 RepID=A0AC35TXH9_9BILA